MTALATVSNKVNGEIETREIAYLALHVQGRPDGLRYAWIAAEAWPKSQVRNRRAANDAFLF